MTQANQHNPLAWLGTQVWRGIGVTIAVLGLALSPLSSRIAAAQQTSPPATATAAEAREPVAELQQVIITGSRIATPNATSTSPIQIVSSREIEISGRTDVSDLLYQLPQNFNNSISQDFSNRTSGLTTAGGLATADLRGLGPQRTLVLVNGRRLGQGDANTSIASPAPDLDQIPLLLVDRIDVVTGGASSVYGSDAIAGVVNFVLKKNFEGLQLDYQIGENWHSNHSSYAQSLNQQAGNSFPTGSSKDGRTRQFNLVAGANLADNRGNVTAYFGYLQQDPVTSGERDFGACQLNANSNNAAGTIDSLACGGSANSNQFTPERLVSAAGVVTPLVSAALAVVGNQLLPWPAAGQNPPAAFNSQQYIYMERQDQRYTAGFLAHLDLHEWLQPYAELGYMNDRTHQEIAPTALFENLNPNDALTNNYNVNCGNPLLSAQEFGALGCTSATDTANVQIGRRNVEGGGRSSDFEHQNYRAVVGAKGAFAEAWDYDAYGQYYYTTLFNSNNKYFNFANVDNALLVTTDPKTGQPACVSGPPCVPYNIFQDGGVTQAALNYLYLSGTAYGRVTERTIHADVTGDLSKYGVKSPFASDGVGVNLGYEHRSDTVAFQPDSGEVSGQLAGFGGAASPINNSISVSEEFIELRVPLVQQKPLAQEVVFDTGFRRSQYSSIGSVNTFKFELQWAPIQDVRLRGSFNRAIRAPAIIELYNPQLIGGLSGIGEDPCAPSAKPGAGSGKAAATLAQCLNTGATAAQYGNGISPSLGGTDTIPQGTGNQLSQLQGGNSQLQAEVASSYTIGVNLTPSFLPTFSSSIDYYHIKLTNGVGTIPGSIAMQGCLTTGNPALCNLIVRSASTGSLNGANIASGGYIVQTNLNVGGALVEGVDIQANYKLPLNGLGSLVFSLAGTVNRSNSTTPFPGAHTYNCAGLFGASCQTVNPRWRHNLRTSWVTPWWDTELFVNWRYMDAVLLDNNSADPTLHFSEFGVYDAYNRRIPSYSYFDVGFTWRIFKELEVHGGINNVLDKDPPLISNELVAGGAANTYETYDTLGRQLFIAFTARF